MSEIVIAGTVIITAILSFLSGRAFGYVIGWSDGYRKGVEDQRRITK